MFTGKNVPTEGFPKGVNSSKTCLYRPGLSHKWIPQLVVDIAPAACGPTHDIC